MPVDRKPEPKASDAPGGGLIKEKVGPLPLVAWVAIGAATFGVVYLMKKRGGSSSSSGGNYGGYDGSGGDSGGGGGSPPIYRPGDPSDPRIDDPIVTLPRDEKPIIGPVDTSPSLTPAKPRAPSYIGKSAGDLAREPVGGWTKPPQFQQTSPTTVIDSTVRGSSPTAGFGVVNPNNKLLGYAGPDGSIFDSPGPGRVAIWK